VAGIDTIEEYSVNKSKILREIDILKEKEVTQEVSYLTIEQVQHKFSTIMELLQSDEDNDVKRTAFGEIVEKVTFSRPDDTVKIYFYL